jgi:hypothetical protein
LAVFRGQPAATNQGGKDLVWAAWRQYTTAQKILGRNKS